MEGNRLSRRCSIPTARSDNVALHRIAGSDATSDVNEEEDAEIYRGKVALRRAAFNKLDRRIDVS